MFLTNLLSRTNKSIDKDDTNTTAVGELDATTTTTAPPTAAISFVEEETTTTTTTTTAITEPKPVATVAIPEPKQSTMVTPEPKHPTPQTPPSLSSAEPDPKKWASNVLSRDVPTTSAATEAETKTPPILTKNGETPTVAMVAHHQLNIIMAELERAIPAFKEVKVKVDQLEHAIPAVTYQEVKVEEEEPVPAVAVPTTGAARDTVVFTEPASVSFAKPKPKVVVEPRDLQPAVSPSTTVTATPPAPVAESTATAATTTPPAPTVETPPAPTHPIGERWAVSHPTVDLTGKWTVVMNPSFKQQYDKYLSSLNQPSLVRKIAGSIVDRTIEDIVQTDDGRTCAIQGTNIRGVWDRTLISSGAEPNAGAGEEIEWDSYEHLRTPIITADSEEVQSEAWWGCEGTVHHSWLLGTRKYGGGDFESRRWLEDGGETLMCESIFHPRKKGKGKGELLWKFTRES